MVTALLELDSFMDKSKLAWYYEASVIICVCVCVSLYANV